jgi:hypothetical protein
VDEPERDRLYGLPLAEFIRARNRLAARLRKAGRADDAAEIVRLRKPGAPLWAINQVARRDPGAVARLIEATDALRRAQLGRAARDDLGPRATAQRAALDRLVDHAASLLHPGGPDAPAATRARLSATALGAAADPRAHEDLRRGRLARELSAPGFEVFAGARPAAPPAPPSRGFRADTRSRRDAEARVRAADRAVRAVRMEARTLDARADRLARTASGAERAASAARQAAEQARQAADQAGVRVRVAEEALAAARRPRVE